MMTLYLICPIDVAAGSPGDAPLGSALRVDERGSLERDDRRRRQAAA
jgi:hypothetical protein